MEKIDCLFCKMISGEVECKKIYEDDKVIAILDLYPDCDGHTLIIPKNHYTDFMELPNQLLDHIMDVARGLTPKLINTFDAKSLSLRVNYLDTQYIKHFHMHLLPNYGLKKATLSQSDAYKKIKETI